MAKDSEESKTVPIYNHYGDVLGYTTPEKAAGAEGERMKEIFGAAPGSSSPSSPTYNQNLGLDFGVPTGMDDDYSWLGDDGRATYNPGWSFGADGTMHWYGDGPRPSKEAEQAWAKAHMANAGQGLIPGTEDNLSLGSPYTNPAPEVEDPFGVAPPLPTELPPEAPVERPVFEVVNPGPGGGSLTPPPIPGTDDTSWDWGQGPVTGEYFGSPPTMNALTMPGEDSPWGVPDTAGGNEEFYRQQFSNLLSQENAMQQAQIAAAMRRQDAAENPRAPEDPTAWQAKAFGGRGLPKVDWSGWRHGNWSGQNPPDGGGGGQDDITWAMTRAWEPGVTTNADLIRMYQDMPGVSGDWSEWLAPGHEANTQVNWGTWDANSGNANPFINGNDSISGLFDAMWSVQR